MLCGCGLRTWPDISWRRVTRRHVRGYGIKHSPLPLHISPISILLHTSIHKQKNNGHPYRQRECTYSIQAAQLIHHRSSVGPPSSPVSHTASSTSPHYRPSTTRTRRVFMLFVVNEMLIEENYRCFDLSNQICCLHHSIYVTNRI